MCVTFPLLLRAGVAEHTLTHTYTQSPHLLTRTRTICMHIQLNRYEATFNCVRKFEKSPPQRSPGPAKTFYFFMHDHGPCNMLGMPDYDYDAQSATWSSPIVSVNGERWSTNAMQPCHNPYRDIVVPTPNMMIPSFEGGVLLNASAHATVSTRATLAFMLIGHAYVPRTMIERLYDSDKDIHVDYRLEHSL